MNNVTGRVSYCIDTANKNSFCCSYATYHKWTGNQVNISTTAKGYHQCTDWADQTLQLQHSFTSPYPLLASAGVKAWCACRAWERRKSSASSIQRNPDTVARSAEKHDEGDAQLYHSYRHYHQQSAIWDIGRRSMRNCLVRMVLISFNQHNLHRKKTCLTSLNFDYA